MSMDDVVRLTYGDRLPMAAEQEAHVIRFFTALEKSGSNSPRDHRIKVWCGSEKCTFTDTHGNRKPHRDAIGYLHAYPLLLDADPFNKNSGSMDQLASITWECHLDWFEPVIQLECHRCHRVAYFGHDIDKKHNFTDYFFNPKRQVPNQISIDGLIKLDLIPPF